MCLASLRLWEKDPSESVEKIKIRPEMGNLSRFLCFFALLNLGIFAVKFCMFWHNFQQVLTLSYHHAKFGRAAATIFYSNISFKLEGCCCCCCLFVINTNEMRKNADTAKAGLIKAYKTWISIERKAKRN